MRRSASHLPLAIFWLSYWAPLALKVFSPDPTNELNLCGLAEFKIETPAALLDRLEQTVTLT